MAVMIVTGAHRWAMAMTEARRQVVGDWVDMGLLLGDYEVGAMSAGT